MDTIRLKKYFVVWIALLIFHAKGHLRAVDSLYGESFQPAKKCEIIWKKNVKNLPLSVPHYTSGDHRFNQKFMQYFRDLGNFPQKSKALTPEHVVSRHDTVIHESESNYLHFSPVTGSMTYGCTQDSNDRALLEAPTVDESKKMAKRLLSELKIDTDAVTFYKVQCTSGTTSRFDQTLGKIIRTRSGAGMFLPRLYEGHPSNHGGVNIAYGLGGVLTEFSICWRDVKLAGRREVPAREQIAKQILEGRTSVMMDAAQNADKLTIKDISVFYREAEPFRKADTVEPFLLIKADSEVDGVTSDCTIYLKLQ
jgi:hypothetical protein